MQDRGQVSSNQELWNPTITPGRTKKICCEIGNISLLLFMIFNFGEERVAAPTVAVVQWLVVVRIFIKCKIVYLAHMSAVFLLSGGCSPASCYSVSWSRPAASVSSGHKKC